MYVRYGGKLLRIGLDSKSENFHKRFHHFRVSRWLNPERGISLAEIFDPPSQDHKVWIDVGDLMEIMKKWRCLAGFNYTEVDPHDFENVVL